MSDMAAAPGYAELGSAFAELARLIRAEPYSSGVELPRALEFAAHGVPHSDHVGLTLVPGWSPPRTVAATSAVVADIDALQLATQEGPCLDDIVDDDICPSDD